MLQNETPYNRHFENMNLKILKKSYLYYTYNNLNVRVAKQLMAQKMESAGWIQVKTIFVI